VEKFVIFNRHFAVSRRWYNIWTSWTQLLWNATNRMQS